MLCLAAACLAALCDNKAADHGERAACPQCRALVPRKSAFCTNVRLQQMIERHSPRGRARVELAKEEAERAEVRQALEMAAMKDALEAARQCNDALLAARPLPETPAAQPVSSPEQQPRLAWWSQISRGWAILLAPVLLSIGYVALNAIEDAEDAAAFRLDTIAAGLAPESLLWREEPGVEGGGTPLLRLAHSLPKDGGSVRWGVGVEPILPPDGGEGALYWTVTVRGQPCTGLQLGVLGGGAASAAAFWGW